MVEPKETNKNPPELPIERFPLAVGAGPQTAFQQETKMHRGSFRDFRYFRGSYTMGSLLEENQSDSRAQNQLTECAHDCCCDCRTVILEPTKWSVRLTIRVFSWLSWSNFEERLRSCVYAAIPFAATIAVFALPRNLSFEFPTADRIP